RAVRRAAAPASTSRPQALFFGAVPAGHAWETSGSVHRWALRESRGRTDLPIADRRSRPQEERAGTRRGSPANAVLTAILGFGIHGASAPADSAALPSPSPRVRARPSSR